MSKKVVELFTLAKQLLSTQEHYDWGHINGAIQYTPKTSLLLDADLKTLPTDKTIVVYCYTGQTSAHVASYLRVLGYDAYTLTFGMNKLFNDNPFWDDPDIKNQWGKDSNPKNLTIITE